MKLAFFSIPVQSPAGVSGELNRFLESHVILGMERQFIQDGQNSLWAVCVSYQDGGVAAADKTSKTDYKEILSEEDFAVYAKLRDLRKELAERRTRLWRVQQQATGGNSARAGDDHSRLTENHRCWQDAGGEIWCAVSQNRH